MVSNEAPRFRKPQISSLNGMRRAMRMRRDGSYALIAVARAARISLESSVFVGGEMCDCVVARLWRRCNRACGPIVPEG